MKYRMAAVAALVGITSLAQAQETALDKAGPLFAQPGAFVNGYVSGISQTLMDEIPYGPHGQEIQRGYAKCLTEQSAHALVNVVQAYLGRHPESNTYSPDAVVNLALHEMCASYLPKIRPN